MNRIFSVVLVLALCALCACAASTRPMPDSSAEPDSALPHDLNSIVEPLEKAPFSEAAAIEEDSAPESSAAAVTDVEPETPVTAQTSRPSASENNSAPLAQEESSAPLTILPKIADEPKQTDANEMPHTEAIEIELLRLINEERAAVGIEALGLEENIRFAAKIRAGEALQSFSHTRPNGSTYNTAFDEADFQYAGKWHGENLSSLSYTPGTFTDKQIAQKMFTSLKNSPGHYQNMLSEKFLQAGIGVAASYETGMINVASAQMFSSL